MVRLSYKLLIPIDPTVRELCNFIVKFKVSFYETMLSSDLHLFLEQWLFAFVYAFAAR